MKYRVFNKITYERRDIDLQGLKNLYDAFTLVSVLAALNKTGEYESKYHQISLTDYGSIAV